MLPLHSPLDQSPFATGDEGQSALIDVLLVPNPQYTAFGLLTEEYLAIYMSTYSRRRIVQTGGIGATALLAGCLDSIGLSDDPEEVTYYVVAFHWGFAAFDADGNEHDVIEVSEGTELTIVAVNDHASDAFGALPDPVESVLEDFDALERTKQLVEDGTIPEPEDHTIEEVYEEAHDHGHDHNDHEEEEHGDSDGNELTMMDHEVIIPEYDLELLAIHDVEELEQETIETDQTGTFDIICTHDCGYGHPYMVKELLEVY